METVTRRVELEISTDELWAAITDREALEAWLGEQVEVDLRPVSYTHLTLPTNREV